jgi:hypothetical protein
MNDGFTFHQAAAHWDEYTLRLKLRKLCGGDWTPQDAGAHGWENPQALAEAFSAPEVERLMLREFDLGRYKKSQLYFMAACILIHCGHATRCRYCSWLSDCLGCVPSESSPLPPPAYEVPPAVRVGA